MSARSKSFAVPLIGGARVEHGAQVGVGVGELPRPGWRCVYIDEIDSLDTTAPASPWVTADSYNPARPFPAIDHITVAI